MLNNKLFYIVFIFLFLVDLLTKRWMESRFLLHQTVEVIPSWLNWNLIHNSGASFGIFSEYTGVLTGVSFIMTLFILYIYYKSKVKSFAVQLGFALLLSGAIGNFVDRIQLGYVIDFIDFRWWPAVFNIADLGIRAGSILLAFLYITKRWDFHLGKSRSEK